MITAARKQVLTYFISLMTFCFLMGVTWADDQLSLSSLLDTKPFAFIRKNPQVFVINVPDKGTQAIGWTRLSLARAITPATNFVFLSVWAISQEKSPLKENYAWIGIRPVVGGSSWAWQRPVGQIYSQQLIYMDVTDPNPLYLLLCPTDESSEIEYYYIFIPGDQSADLDNQFEITVLGYLEGEWK